MTLIAGPVKISDTVPVSIAATVLVDNSGVTQPISAASLPLPTGAATAARQDTGNTSLSSLDGKVTACNTGAVTVSALPADVDIRNLTAAADVVTVMGGVGQTADVKVTLDSETVPVTGTFWQVTQPVSGTVSANAGTGTYQVGDAGAVINLDAGGDVQADVLTVPAPLSTTGGGTEATALRVTLASDSTGVVSVDDNGSSLTVDGTVTDGGSGKTLKSTSVSLSATGTAISAVTGKKLKVYAVKLVVSAAISVNWRDGASTGLEGAQALAANGGYVESVNPPAFLFATSAGNSLDLDISGTGTAAGRVSYWDDDAT